MLVSGCCCCCCCCCCASSERASQSKPQDRERESAYWTRLDIYKVSFLAIDYQIGCISSAKALYCCCSSCSGKRQDAPHCATGSKKKRKKNNNIYIYIYNNKQKQVQSKRTPFCVKGIIGVIYYQETNTYTYHSIGAFFCFFVAIVAFTSRSLSLQMLPVLCLIFLMALAHSADIGQFAYKGCYDASDVQSLGLISKGSYIYQSVSYCENECLQYDLVALFNGKECYCGDSSALSSLQSLQAGSSSSCSVECAGWPYQNCGGSSFMDVYTNSLASVVQSTSLHSSTQSTSTTIVTTSSTITTSTPTTGSISSTSTTPAVSSTLSPSSSSSSSSSNVQVTTHSSIIQSSTPSSSSSSSSSSSTFSSTSSSIFSSTSSSASPSSSTWVSTLYTTHVVTTSVVTTSNDEAKTVFVTRTSVIPAATASNSTLANSPLPKQDSTNSKRKISGGAIAGIVVGVVCGVIIAAIILLVLWRRHHSTDKARQDIEEAKQYQPYSIGDVDANPMAIPHSNSATSNWRIPSRNNTAMSTDSHSNFSAFVLPTRKNSTPNINNNNSTAANYSPSPFEMSNSMTSMANMNDNSSSGQSNTNLVTRFHYPSTVFEEPPSIYNGTQRFSATSLPDMMEDRQLRIVNPDGDDDEGFEYQGDGDDDTESSGIEPGTKY